MKSLSVFIMVLAALTVTGCSYAPLTDYSEIDPNVSITETRTAIEISLKTGPVSDTALIFYPGGLVDNHVYDEILADFCVAAGVKVVVAKMPANLAVFKINAGKAIIEAHPEISEWVIAGHSLGGSMAASEVNRNRELYSGLIFMDSYPADGDSLQDWQGRVLSLFSSIEKISDQERMSRTLSLLPEAFWLTADKRSYPAKDSNYSVLHQIDGGSHSYFGTYGPQDGDYTPTITREAFHAEVVDYMTQFFTENGWR